MKKKASKSPIQNPGQLVLVTAISVLVVMVGLLFYQTMSFGKEFDDLEARVEEEKTLLYNEIDYQKSLQRPVVLAKEKQVVFPEIGIALPYNEITKTLQYYMDPGNEEMRVTSTMINDREVRQMSCSQLVRISTKSGQPYSPWEKSAGSVKLADGKTVYIIEAKAFKNNEASTMECEPEVWHSIGPGLVSTEFSNMRQY
jgi:hypothetical protein